MDKKHKTRVGEGGEDSRGGDSKEKKQYQVTKVFSSKYNTYNKAAFQMH